MSVPLRRNRMNGIKVKVIAMVMNKTRRKRLGRGCSSHLARTPKVICNRARTLINANQKGTEIWKPAIQEILSSLIPFVTSRLAFHVGSDLVPASALFVGMGNLKNARLVERFSQKLQPNRQFLPAL